MNKMKNFLLPLICIFVVASFGCAGKSSATNKKEVFIKDNYRTTKDGDVLIDDRDFERIQEPIATTKAGFEEPSKPSIDNSQVNMMVDGFGNKTETRVFVDHPLLQRVVVRTNGTGQKKAFVYGHNGDVNSLPNNIMDNAMTASANDLAKSAGIFNGRNPENEPYFLAILRPQPEETLLPLAGYEFPVITNIIQQSEPEKPADVIKQIFPPAEPPPTPMAKPTATPAPPKNYQSEINKILLQSVEEK